MTAPQSAPESVAPQVVPLQAIFATDFCPVLVAVTTAHTIDEVAAEVARHAEGHRVRALPYPKVVIHEGRELSGDLTVAQAGIGPLDHIAVEYVMPPASVDEQAPAGTQVR